jgi:hypothetical protein
MTARLAARLRAHGFVISLIAGLATEARAHDVLTAHGIEALMPATRVGIEAVGATLGRGEGEERWQGLVLGGEWAARPSVSVAVAAPVLRSALAGAGAVTGVGDPTLTLKVALHGTPHGEALVAAGLAVTLPAGSEDDHLGTGHVVVAPFVSGSSALASHGPWEWLVYGTITPRWALTRRAGQYDDGPRSVAAPHAEREIGARAMSALVLGRVHAAVGGEGAVVLLGKRDPYVAASLEVGGLVTAAPRVRALVGCDAGLAGERRVGVRVRGGLAALF